MYYFDEDYYAPNFFGDFRDEIQENDKFKYHDSLDWMEDFERAMNDQTSFNYAF